MKELIISKLLVFVNGKIAFFLPNQSRKTFKKMALNLENSAESTKKMLKMSLLEIFSLNIRKNFTSYSKTHNKRLVIDLLNNKIEDIKSYFNNLFRLTFLDVYNHLVGNSYFELLSGLEQFNEFDKYSIKIKEPENLDNYINRYEHFIMTRKKRRRK